jgi:hypothetical protein
MEKKATKPKTKDEMRPEYDFSKLQGIRGKYVNRYRGGTNFVPSSGSKHPLRRLRNKDSQR